MVLRLFIVVICYLPILDSILPKTNFGVGIPDIGPTRLGSYLLFLAFIIHWAATKQTILFHKWIRFLIVFFIIVVASISWSKYSYDASTLQNIFNSVFIPLFFAVVAINLFEQEDNTKLYMKHIIIGSFILSLISISQIVFGIIAGQEEIRATGTLGNPNALAIFLVLTIPCIMYGMEKSLISPVLGRMATAVVVGGIVCTVSRKGIITMVLCFCLYNFFKKKYKKIIFFLVGVAIVGILLSSWYAVFSLRFEQDEVQHHIEEKWNMTRAGWKMFQTSPIIGLGYKGYYENFNKYFPYSWAAKYDSHNIFITALANYGILGFIPFMGILLYPLFRAIKIVRKKNKIVSNEYSRDMAIICICSMIPFMISGWGAGGLFYEESIISLLYTNIALFLSTTS